MMNRSKSFTPPLFKRTQRPFTTKNKQLYEDVEPYVFVPVNACVHVAYTNWMVGKSSSDYNRMASFFVRLGLNSTRESRNLWCNQTEQPQRDQKSELIIDFINRKFFNEINKKTGL